jgi:TolB-like protein
MSSPLARSWIRHALLAGAILATLSPGVFLLKEGPFRGSSPTDRAGDSRIDVTVPPRRAPAGDAAESERADAKTLGVMEFVAMTERPETVWMANVIRDNLSSQLSNAQNCKVFSKEFIDFKAQGLVRQGMYADVRKAAIDAADQLGVGNAIFGRYNEESDVLYIEAYVVDMKTGVRRPADHVQGPSSRFSDLQGQLASKIMVRLGLAPLAVADSTGQGTEADRNATLDGYKLLLDAEGGAKGVAKPASGAAPEMDPISRRDSRKPWTDRGGSWLVGEASAAEDQATADARVAILRTIETYRRAYEEKDLKLLADVYGPLSPEQADAATKYFANAEGLQVAIDDVDVAVDGSRAAVSYTRRDKFKDAKTGEERVLQVRLTKLLAQQDTGSWRIQQAVK